MNRLHHGTASQLGNGPERAERRLFEVDVGGVVRRQRGGQGGRGQVVGQVRERRVGHHAQRRGGVDAANGAQPPQ